jgi:cytochrome c2
MKRVILLLFALLLAGCGTRALPAWLPPPVDPARGEMIFRHGLNGAPPCVGCHALAAGGFTLGPVLAGVNERAATRVEGLSADEYIHQSIVAPRAYLVPGYRDLMYPDYAEHLTEQDIADLIAFLHTLSS